MRQITFHTGGFPLTHETLEFLQDASNDIINAWIKQMNLETGVNYIIAGCEIDGTNVGNGWMVINDELIQFESGTGLYVAVTDTTTSVVYEDTNSKSTYSWKKATASSNAADPAIADFRRLSNNFNVKRADCNHLSGRVYEYQLLKNTTSIHVNADGDYVTNSGFILNRILPFDGINHGHELLVRLGVGTGITFYTANSLQSNILFNRAESTSSGDELIRPRFSGSAFIGSISSNAQAINQDFYDQNVHLKLQWNAVYQKWVEIVRFTIQEGSI